MSNGLSYEQVVELLPAYTLGALEPDELLAVEDYLEQQRALLTAWNGSTRQRRSWPMHAHSAPVAPDQINLAGTGAPRQRPAYRQRLPSDPPWPCETTCDA
ncbi:MAG: hypothetical protein R3E79_15525 [Caldilineaceae bacterium]